MQEIIKYMLEVEEKAKQIVAAAEASAEKAILTISSIGFAI